MTESENKLSTALLMYKQPFSREELQDICDRAQYQVSEVATNPLWERAYYDLAKAADYLDLMMARTENHRVP
jgi:hypothetical protein